MIGYSAKWTSKHRIVAIAALLLVAASTPAAARPSETFTNPLLPLGPDPWVIRHGGYYYFTDTLGNRIELWKARYIVDLRSAPSTVVWRAPGYGPGSASLWAPELHFISGKWYIYYAASDKRHDNDAHRRLYVLENAAPDPTKGHWQQLGPLRTTYAGIDPTVFHAQHTLYLLYSAYVGDHSDLILAPMKNPWTIGSPQVDIAHPAHRWQMHGGRKILEAPEVLKGPKGALFIVYSASACWSDHYALGMLSAARGANILDPASWHHFARPVFKSSPDHKVYGPGGANFFRSPDGTQTWMIYQAKSIRSGGCTHRSPRIQQINWSANGTPIFGVPVRTGVPLPVPSR